MTHPFAGDRAGLTGLQTRILQRIRTRYWLSAPRTWPTRQEILVEFGVAEATAAIAALPPGAVESTPGQFGLGLIGLLLSDEGARSELFLNDYLELAKARSKADPRAKELTSEQLRSAYDMTDQELDLLGHAIERGILHDGINELNGPRWNFLRPANIADLVALDDFGAYIRGHALEMGKRTASRGARPAAGPARVGDPGTHTPSAFISYSWDSEDHKAWVRALATRLRQDGISTILDQWATVPGDQLPAFMERALRENDYVLVICTPRYKQRSEARAGGVGYEGDIMTAELLARGNQRKFIPVLASGPADHVMPSWLRGKYHVDLSGQPYDEAQYHDLLTTTHGLRPTPPPIGRPFSTVTSPPQGPSVTRPSSAADDDIRIEGVIVDEVTDPRNDGTPGCALYTVPLRLSKRPDGLWSDLLVRNWNMPPAYDTWHRPGILSVRGDQAILDGTTIEEIRDHHRETLRLVIEKTNREYREIAQRQRAQEEREGQERDAHRRSVREQARDLSFDDED